MVVLLLDISVYAQEPVTLITSSSNVSPISISNTVSYSTITSSPSLIAMSGYTGCSLAITNTTASGSISSSFQIGFPTDFCVQFPSPTKALDPAISIPEPPTITNVNGVNYNVYMVKINSLSGNNNMVELFYNIESGFLSDFDPNSHQSARNIIFTTSDPSNIVIDNNLFSQSVTVVEGQSILLDPTIRATDNLSTSQYDGAVFTRTYHLVSNGINNTPFTGSINFSDNLGPALQLVSLQVILPDGTSITVPPANIISSQYQATLTDQTITTTAPAINISTSIDLSTLIIGGLVVDAEIQIIETIKVSNCLFLLSQDGKSQTDIRTGISTVNINWQESSTSCSLSPLQSFITTVSEPTNVIGTTITYITDPLYFDSQGHEVICYRTDPNELPNPTPESSGVYINSKTYTNPVGSGINLSNVRFQINQSVGYNSKIPLEGVKLERINPDNSLTTLIDFSNLPASQVLNNGNYSSIIAQYSSYTNTSVPVDNNVNDQNPNQNKIDLYINGSDCSSSNFQIVSLLLDQYPGPDGQPVPLDYREGYGYKLTWQEVQCCRTYAFVANHSNNDIHDLYGLEGTQRWGNAVIALQYPGCVNWMNIDNMNGTSDWTAGYFNILQMSQSFLANTTKLYQGHTATLPGQLGDVYIETDIQVIEGMDAYPLTDNGLPVFLDIDVMLTDGLSLNTQVNNPSNAPAYIANIQYQGNGTLLLWNPVSVTPNAIPSPIYLTSADDKSILPGQSIPVVEYYTIRYNMNDFFTNVLGLDPVLNADKCNVGYILNALANSNIYFSLQADGCPNSAYVSVSSYILNKPSCSTCRNLIANAVFTAIIDCPGCITPGPAIYSATSLRDPSDWGSIDNNNDGVPDDPQPDILANPTLDKRNKNYVRIGDILNTNIMASMPDGDNSKGFTYTTLISNYPSYIQSDAYLRTMFNWTTGGLEIQKISCTVTHKNPNSNAAATTATITLLDINGGMTAPPGRGYILMNNGTPTPIDYIDATSDQKGFKTNQYSTFYFHVNLSDFGIVDPSGFNFGASDYISFDIDYLVVNNIAASDNIIEVDYLMYTAPSSVPPVYPGSSPNQYDVEIKWSGIPLTSIDQLPSLSDPSNTDQPFFWCTSGVSIFGFVPYDVDFSNFLQDPYTNQGPVDNSCQKVMHLVTEVWPKNLVGNVNYNAFENEYRPVNHPTQIQVQIPQGYTIDKIEFANSTDIPIYGTRSNSINEYIYLTPPPPGSDGLLVSGYSNGSVTVGTNNMLTITVPPYEKAINPGPATLGDINDDGKQPTISQFEQMNDMLYLELMITIHSDCGNNNVSDYVCWYDKNASPPYSGSAANYVDAAVITTQSLPDARYVLASPEATESIYTYDGNGDYLRPENNYYFIIPKTKITADYIGPHTNLGIGTKYFDFGVQLTNNPPLDANGQPFVNPYNTNTSLPAVNADHTYISFNKASLPSGFVIDYIYESQSPIMPIPPLDLTSTNPKFYAPKTSIVTDYIFDLGQTLANQTRTFWVVGEYNCSTSGCDPFTNPLPSTCMNDAPVNLYYGWNCKCLTDPLSPSCADSNIPLTYTFTNDPVQAEIIVPSSEMVSYCQPNQYAITLKSLQSGSITNYLVKATLPSNAVYIPNATLPNSSTLNGVAIGDPAISIDPITGNNILTYNIDLSESPSSVTSANATNILQFNYTFNCVSPESSLLTVATNVVITSYCGDQEIYSPTPTTLAIPIFGNYDNLMISSMQGTSGNISQGTFSSTITVQNTSLSSTGGTNVLQVTLPAGVTLDASSNTTSGYSIPDPVNNPNVLIWPVSTLAGNSSASYTVSYAVAPFSTSCQESFVVQATVTGQPVLCNGSTVTCNAPVNLSSSQCSTTVSSGILPVMLNTSNGSASILCSGGGAGSTVTFVGSVKGGSGNYNYTWSGPGLPANGVSDPGVPTSNQTVSMAGVYTVMVSDGYGCSGSVSGTVFDQVNTICPGDICPGDNPNLQLDLGGVIGTYQVDWYNSSNPGVAIGSGITEPGVYYGLVIIPACTLQTSNCQINFKPYPQPYQISPGGPTGLCKNQTITLTVDNPTVNDLSYTTVGWSTGQTGLGPLSISLDQNFYNSTNVDGSENSYTMVATNTNSGCVTISNPAYVYSPATFINRQCTNTSGEVLLTASSNLAAGSYTWTYSAVANGPLQTLTSVAGSNGSQVLATQAGYYYVQNDATRQCASSWGIYENMVVSASPNTNQIPLNDGRFEGYQVSDNCSLSYDFGSDYPCLDQDGFKALYPTEGFTTTVGKYMINYGTLKAGDWNLTPGQWNFVPYNENGVSYPNNFMVIDGIKSPSDQRIWYMNNIPVSHNLYYLFQASLLNIDVSSQGSIATEIPEVYQAIVYRDASGNAIGHQDPFQIFFSTKNPQWLQISELTLAGYGLMVNNVPITAVTADLAIIMRGGGAVGRDLALDDIQLIPIGICDDVSSIISQDTRGCGVDFVSVDNTDKFTCSGVGVTFNAYQIGTDPNLQFTWADATTGQILQTGSGNSPSALSFTATPSITTGYTLTVVDKVNQCTSTIPMTAYVVSPSLHIASTPSNANICLTSPLNFAVDQFVGIGGVGYQWLVNGTAVAGATGTSYSSTTLKGQDQVMCTLVSGCLTPNNTPLQVNSNVITVIGSQLGINPAGVAKSVCVNGSVQIGAAPLSGAVYSWSPSLYLDDPTKSNPTVTPTGTETSLTYTLTGTDANGCTTTDQVVVTVNALPAAPSGSGGSVCSQGSIQLRVVNPITGYTYNWYDAATGGNLVSTGTEYTTTPILATTSYYLSATDNNGCMSSTSPVTVTVNPLPSAPMGAGGSVCGSGQVELTVENPVTGYVYSWYNAPTGGTQEGKGSSYLSPILTMTTIYYLSAKDHNGCMSPRTAVVATVNPVPSATVSASPSPLCVGSSAGLTETVAGGTAPYSYSWSSTPAGFSSSLANPVVSPVVTTTYKLVVTDQNNCKVSASTKVTVDPLPVTSGITGPSLVCANQTMVKYSVLNAKSGSTYQWEWAGSSGVSFSTLKGGNGSVITVDFTTGSGTLSVQETSNGCKGAAVVKAVTVDLPVAPTITIIPGQEVCAGTEITIGGSYNPSYKAFPTYTIGLTHFGGYGIMGNFIEYGTIVSGGTVSIRVLDNNGCSNSTTVAVKVDPSPATPQISGVNTVCMDQTETYNVAPVSGIIYHWTATGATIANGTQPSVVAQFGSSANATLNLTETMGNCSTTAGKSVTVDPVSILTINGVLSSYCVNKPASVGYHAPAQCAQYASDNVFSVQLSDAGGSFANPVVIGSIKSKTPNGTIPITFKGNTPNGTNYRMRIVSSDPYETGPDNGVNITLNMGCRFGFLEGNDSTVESNSVRIYPNPFTSETNIMVSSNSGTTGHLRIFNLQGSLVYQREINFNEVYTMGGDLASSMYFVEITEENQNPKIIKILKE
jgi:hypothetical protein